MCNVDIHLYQHIKKNVDITYINIIMCRFNFIKIISTYHVECQYTTFIQCQHTILDVNISCIVWYQHTIYSILKFNVNIPCWISTYHVYSMSRYHVRSQHTMINLMSAYHLFNIEIKCHDTMMDVNIPYLVWFQHTIYSKSTFNVKIPWWMSTYHV